MQRVPGFRGASRDPDLDESGYSPSMGIGEPYSDDEDENIVENFVMVEKPTATSKLHLAPNASGPPAAELQHQGALQPGRRWRGLLGVY